MPIKASFDLIEVVSGSTLSLGVLSSPGDQVQGFGMKPFQPLFMLDDFQFDESGYSIAQAGNQACLRCKILWNFQGAHGFIVVLI